MMWWQVAITFATGAVCTIVALRVGYKWGRDDR